jgi:hypothetical protein
LAGMRDALNSLNHKGYNDHEGPPPRFSFVHFVPFVFKIFSTENIWAFVLFLIVIALIIFTTDSSPAWIYQGF